MPIDRIAVSPRFTWLYNSEFELAKAVTIGPTTAGFRKIVPIVGGSFEGERLSGEVLPGGADHQLVRSDGAVEVEARYTLRTTDGALIDVRNAGILRAPPDVLAELAQHTNPDPTRYYFRTRPQFETSHAGYTWLTRIVSVAVAEVRRPGVLVTVYAVD